MTVRLEAVLVEGRARRRLPAPETRRFIRQRAGVSQEALAGVLGVTQAAVSKWESGERTPRGPLLREYLGVLDRLAAEVGGAA